MSTSAIPGFNGQVFISIDGGTNYKKLGELRDMTINIEAELIDATSHDSGGWREFIAGLKNWSISHEGLFIETNVGQADARSALLNDTALKVRFRPKDLATKVQFSGDAFMSSEEQANPNDDASTFSTEIQGTGPLVEETIA